MQYTQGRKYPNRQDSKIIQFRHDFCALQATNQEATATHQQALVHN